MKSKNKDSNKIIAYICYKVYLINNFKIKFLINIDILKSKQVVIDILNRKLRFEFYKEVAIFCEIKIKNNIRIRQIVCTTKKKIIFARLIAKIVVTLKEKSKLFKYNFLFEFIIFKIYIYFVNINF